jgi:predicted ATPase
VSLWLLGYPEAALADAEDASKLAREIGHPATLMYALSFPIWTHIQCGNYAAASAQADENIALADEKSIVLWRGFGMASQGQVLSLTGRASDAVQMITSAITRLRSTGTTMWMPLWLAYLARNHAELGQIGEAGRCIGEAVRMVETTNERWSEAEIHRIAGEIALLSPEPDPTKANACFKQSLAVAGEQQANSWELRAAMSMARLWRDQGKRDDARELLAPVYGWFTEGFDTRDLKEARALLDELAA